MLIANYNKVSDYQLRQVLKSITGDAEVLNVNIDPDFIDAVRNTSSLCLPTQQLFLIEPRIPVFADIVHPKKSIIINQLLDRKAEAALAVDAYLRGKDSLFLIQLIEDKSQLGEWIRCMRSELVELTIKPIDAEMKVLIAPLKSFASCSFES